MIKRNFWPLDFDPEGEVYENVAWDLPGYTHNREQRKRRARQRPEAAPNGKNCGIKTR
jgi:hypothetical protein